MSVIVIGFDPSVASFGISDGTRHDRFVTKPDATRRARILEIFEQIERWISNGFEAAQRGEHAFVFVYEGAIYGAQASAQFDAGYVRALFDALAESWGATVYEVAPATLKKFATGKGNAKKHDLPLLVYQRYGVEFADDPGRDKLHAYLLHRYGVDLIAGRIEHAAPRRRGKGGNAVAGLRKAARKRGTVAA